jgi:hypothetical protein
MPLAVVAGEWNELGKGPVVVDNVVDFVDVSFPYKSSSAQRLGIGAREPLANINERHCSVIGPSIRPGESNFNTM